MGEQATLAHAGGLRKPSNGEPVDSLHRCEPRSGLQDPLPAARAVCTSAARLSDIAALRLLGGRHAGVYRIHGLTN